MLQALWKPEVRLDAGSMHAEVGAFEWPSPSETHERLDSPQLSLSLTPQPSGSRLRYEWEQRATGFAKTGDLVFLPSAIPFTGRCDGGHQRLLTCSFNMPASRSAKGEWTEAELIAGLDLKDMKLRSILARIAQELLNPGLASALLVEALLTTATIDLMRFLEGRRTDVDEAAKGGLAPWQLRRIRERVEQADAPAPSIEALAKLAGISARHLMRGFKKSNGTTLHNYVEQVRLDRAKTFLLNTDLPLKTISWQLGFAHASSFSSAFQRALGVTPTAFRAQSSRH